MPQYKVLTDFVEAVDCRTNIHHKEGDMITVPVDDVESWAEAGWIDLDPAEGEAPPSAGRSEDETDDVIIVIGEDHVLLSEADKDQLEAYALEQFAVNLDKRKSTEKLMSEVQKLINTGKD